MNSKSTITAEEYRKKVKEKSVHKQVVDWLRLQHPGALFRSDAAGIRLTIGQAKQFANLQSCRAFPDLQVLEVRVPYIGLFIEIKRSRDEVYCNDGSLRKIEHIQEQQDMLERLAKKGYRAVFGCGFEHCQKIINDYLG